MRVQVVQPVEWEAGEMVAAEDINEIFLYAQDAIEDVAEKRYQQAPLVFQMVQSVSSPYALATDAEVRTARFIPMNNLVVDRAFLVAHIQTAAEVTLRLVDNAGAVPFGATDPLLSTGSVAIPSSITRTTDISVDRFQLTAGVEYRLILSSSAAFTAERCDVILHVTSDRFAPSNPPQEPAFRPQLISEVGPSNAALAITDNQSALTTELAKLASLLSAPVPETYSWHNVVAATPIDQRRCPLPRSAPTRAEGVLRRVQVFATMATVGGGTVSAIVRNESGTQVAIATANVAGVLRATGTASVAVSMSGVTALSEDPTRDYTIEVVNSSAVNCLKAQVVLWIDRA